MTLQFDCARRYRDGFELDVAFEAGEGVTAVCGPSGSGKTTILMLIAGLLRPDRGRISADDAMFVDVKAGVWMRPERRAVGMTFQDDLLFPHRSVRANLLYGRRRDDSRIALDDVAETLELADLLDRRPATLSGGQARRVAIGRALLRGPRLLLLDEPWAGLEDPLRDRITKLVRQCVEAWDIPTLLVSHDRTAVRALADQVVEIERGRRKVETRIRTGVSATSPSETPRSNPE